MDRQEHSCIFSFREEIKAMNKFFGKIFLASIPFLVYIALFVKYEPYNYWGIKPEKSGNWATPLARVREFMRHPSENIILGDSRMNHFDLDSVEEQTGVKYANLSTGGQAYNLSLQLYEWAKSKTNIQSLIVDASFYQIRKGNMSPSAEPVFLIAEEPLTYFVTRDYVIEAFDLCYNDIKKYFGKDVDDIKTDTEMSDGKYRGDLIHYATQNIYPGCQNYSIGEEQMEYITQIVDDVKEQGGKVIIVIPPIQESIWDYVIRPLELEADMAKYKEILIQHATLYDGEWISEFSMNQDIYADGFHFLLEDGYQQFQNAIFIGNENILKVRKCPTDDEG